MSKFRLALLSGLVLVIGFNVTLAETRGKAYNEEQLFEKSTIVFVGEILDTKVYDKYKRSVPTKARVLLSLKGKVERDERRVTPKDPAKSAYFDEEFSPAIEKEIGVFYLETTSGDETLLLGYRRIEP